MNPYKICLALILAFITSSVSAQPVTPENSPFYVRVYGAYGLLAPGSYKGDPRLYGPEPVKFNVAKTGMGAGIRAGAGFGFILNEFINIGIDGEYLLGNKLRLEEETSADEAKYEHFSYNSLEARRSYTNEVISIIPHIVFKAISKPKYYVYDRLGVVIGIPLNMTEQYFLHRNFQKYTDPVGSHTLEYADQTVIYNGKHTLKTAIGYQFSLGVQTVLGEKLRGFFEITAYCISFDRNKYEDKERLKIEVLKNNSEVQQPTVYDHSRFIYQYIKTGETGSDLRGVPYNQVTTIRYSQDPIRMNAITAGVGLAYRF